MSRFYSVEGMKAISEKEIRASFVNCSKGEARRMALPRGLDEQPWDDLDFLGWRDPGAPERGYLVAEHGGALAGVVLRLSVTARGHTHSGLCSLCLTSHSGSGVALMVARRAKRDTNSVGLYVCSDLACSLYVRGKKIPDLGGRFVGSIPLEEQIDQTRARLATFVDKVLSAD